MDLKELPQWTRNRTLRRCAHIALILLVALFASAILCLTQCFSFSPLFSADNLFWTDGSIYAVFARMMAEGKVPYVDILDIKGPYMYGYSYLGYLIHPTYGYLVTQMFSTALLLALTYETLDLVGCRGIYRWTAMGLMTLGTCIAIEGNNADDSFLFLIALCLWCLIRVGRTDRAGRSAILALLCGLALGIEFLTRASNAIIPGVCACLMVAIPAERKRLKQALAIVGAGVAGIAVACVIPMAIYAGLGHFEAFCDWNFVYPFTYVAGHIVRAEKLWIIVLLTLALVATLVPVILLRKNMERGTFIGMLVLLILQYLAGASTYQIIRHLRGAFPVYTLALAVCFTAWNQHQAARMSKEAEKLIEETPKGSRTIEAKPQNLAKPNRHRLQKAFLALSALAVPLVYTASSLVFYRTDIPTGYRIQRELAQVGQSIPSEDREAGTILAVDINPGIYGILNTVPDFPVPALQSWNETFVPDIEQRVVDYVQDEASWVIVRDSEYEHSEITPIYRRPALYEALEASFQMRLDLSHPGVYTTWERIS